MTPGEAEGDTEIEELLIASGSFNQELEKFK